MVSDRWPFGSGWTTTSMGSSMPFEAIRSRTGAWGVSHVHLKLPLA